MHYIEVQYAYHVKTLEFIFLVKVENIIKQLDISHVKTSEKGK